MNSVNFSKEEMNMLGIYRSKSRVGTIQTFQNIAKYFQNDAMKQIARACAMKLGCLSDDEYDILVFAI